MVVVVIGASGGTGRACVAQALGHGHEVRAVVRDPSSIPERPERLRVMRGDVRDADSLREAVAGADAVLSAIGATPSREVDLYSTGIGNTMEAMIAGGVSRIAVVSAAGTFHRNDRNLSVGYRMLMKTALAGLYADLERMEERIMASDLEWTIARPSGLTDTGLTGEYRVGMDGRPLQAGGRISRADVAAFLLKAVQSDVWLRRAVTLSY